MIIVRVLNPSRNRLGDAPAATVSTASPTAVGPVAGRATVSTAEPQPLAEGFADNRTISRRRPVRHGRPTTRRGTRAA